MNECDLNGDESLVCCFNCQYLLRWKSELIDEASRWWIEGENYELYSDDFLLVFHWKIERWEEESEEGWVINKSSGSWSAISCSVLIRWNGLKINVDTKKLWRWEWWESESWKVDKVNQEVEKVLSTLRSLLETLLEQKKVNYNAGYFFVSLDVTSTLS